MSTSGPRAAAGPRSVHQPDGGILADATAGLALPHQHNAREETSMVEPNGSRPATTDGGAR